MQPQQWGGALALYLHHKLNCVWDRLLNHCDAFLPDLIIAFKGLCRTRLVVFDASLSQGFPFAL